MGQLCYDDDLEYPVEIFDHVEVKIDGNTFNGIVKAIHPRSREVSVTYDDYFDLTKTTVTPRRKSHRAHISAVDLLRRDC